MTTDRSHVAPTGRGSPHPASEHTRALHQAALRELPFADREDFADAARGLIARKPDSLLIRDKAGRTVWDMDAYAFVDPEDPR